MDFTTEIKRRFDLQQEFLGTNKIVNNLVPLVSISVATYQHGSFITKCLNEILAQKTTFNYEIIIGEDDSNDDTRRICIDFAKRYPDKIRLFLRDRKLSQLFDDNGKLVKRLNGVLTFGIMSARGKYIALCEGDDYWSDPLKLQKQIEFLEANKDYGMVYGQALVYKDKEQTFEGIVGRKISNNILFSNPVTTLTTVFKRELFFKYQEEIKPIEKYWKMGDYPFWLWIYFNSRIKYFNEQFAVYRILEKSASQFGSDFERKLAFKENIMTISSFFANKYVSGQSLKLFYRKWYFYLYLICVKYKLKKSLYYLNKIKYEKHASFIQKTIIFLIEKVGLKNFF